MTRHGPAEGGGEQVGTCAEDTTASPLNEASVLRLEPGHLPALERPADASMTRLADQDERDLLTRMALGMVR